MQRRRKERNKTLFMAGVIGNVDFTKRIKRKNNVEKKKEQREIGKKKDTKR
jgi:hypothetical protein